MKCDCKYSDNCNIGDGRQEVMDMSKECQWKTKQENK